MKKLFVVLSVFIFGMSIALPADAGWVNGYYRSNGTYVNGYYRSDPNGIKYDNYSWRSGDDLYNDSYYDSGYSSNWYTPSWDWQDDYWSGYDYYNSYNDYDYYDSYWDY